MPSHAHEPLCAARAQRLATALRLSVRLVLAGLLVLPPGVTPAMPAHVQAAARFTPVAPIRVATTGLFSAQPGTSNISSTSDTAQQRALSQLRSRAELLTELARREKLTIRELALRVAAGRGHHIVMGTARDVADRMQEWFENGAADGFNVMPPFFPGGLEEFNREVVPLLQERGLFRTDYEGSTLRDHLGIARPTLRG